MDPSDIANFKAYLEFLPFAFDDLKSSLPVSLPRTRGRRPLLLRYQSCSGACWLVAVAMVPEEHRFDPRLQCERILQEQARPDMSISVVRQSGTLYDSAIFLCLEFIGQRAVPPALSPKQPASKHEQDWCRRSGRRPRMRERYQQ